MESNQKYPFPTGLKFWIAAFVPSQMLAIMSKTTIALYYTDYLNLPDNISKQYYHLLFVPLGFAAPISAFLADSHTGYWKQIVFSLSFITAISTLPVLATYKPWNLPSFEIFITFIVLYSVALSAYLCCAVPFVGQQFVLPQQEKQLEMYFMLSYWTNNVIGIIASIITPIIRTKIHCFGDSHCFFAVFVAVWLMHLFWSGLTFLGFFWYKRMPPAHSKVFGTFFSIIWYSMKTKRKSIEEKRHFLDYALDKYEKSLVDDVRKIQILLMFISAPFFWAMYEQENTAWIFQARRLDGRIGGFRILPAQMFAFNQFLNAILVPIFIFLLYPLLDRYNILSTLLQRMIFGGLLFALAFFYASFFCKILEQGDLPRPTRGRVHVRIYNNMDCLLNMRISHIDKKEITVEPLNFYVNTNAKLRKRKNVTYSFSCGSKSDKGTIELRARRSFGVSFRDGKLLSFEDSVDKEKKSRPKVKTLINSNRELQFQYLLLDDTVIVTMQSKNLTTVVVPISELKFKIENHTISEDMYDVGGVYVNLVDASDSDRYKTKRITVTKPNNVHILWMIPQYVLAVSGEIMFTISGNQFAYTQAPVLIKSCITGFWQMTIAIGNLMVLCVEFYDFKYMSNSLLSYAVMMLVVTVVYIYLARKYKYVEAANVIT